MRATIGNSLLAKLKPKDKPYDVRDERLTGFIIRVNITGKLVYMCEYARGKRITLGRADILTPAQARDMAKEVLADAVKGIDPKLTKKNNLGITLKTFIESHYFPWVEAHRKDAIKTIARIRRCFCKPFGNKLLIEITPILLDQWRTQRLLTGRSTQTVNRDIATFKAALSKAVEWDFIAVHPLAKLKLLKVDNSAKIRYLSEDEEIRLRKALDEREEKARLARDHANKWRKERNYELLPDLHTNYFIDYIKPMVLISINTGLRRGELFNLSVEDIDFSLRVITIAGGKAKSGKTRHVPLNNEACDVLKKWCEQTLPKDLIFPAKNGCKLNNVYKAWFNILASAQINNFRWHDLRHHFASRLIMEGVDLNTVRELLGHSDIKMTLRYAHLAPEHKAEAVARLVKKSKAMIADGVGA